MRQLGWVLMLWATITAVSVQAGEVEIVGVRLVQMQPAWQVHVTLRHADSGWDHYADAWRVVDAAGNELAKRVLYHPHVDEQPFTRSLGGVQIPSDTTVVFIEAHDKVHGWSSHRVPVDLKQAEGERYRIERR